MSLKKRTTAWSNWILFSFFVFCLLWRSMTQVWRSMMKKEEEERRRSKPFLLLSPSVALVLWMSDLVGKKLYDAAEYGRVSEVWSLLRDHPEINVNWTNPDHNQWTALHTASLHDHVEVVKLLLAHPDINVNMMNVSGRTPLSKGCQCGKVSVVQVLLKDPRVDAKLDDNHGRTPLWWASLFGKHKVIEWLIASGRDLGDVKNKKGKWIDKDCTALKIARKNEKTELVLERFIANPAQTRHELRVKLVMLDEVAAEIFALTVFLCDDLLQLKPASRPAAAAAIRFFAIAKRLPMGCRWSCAIASLARWSRIFFTKTWKQPSNLLLEIFFCLCHSDPGLSFIPRHRTGSFLVPSLARPARLQSAWSTLLACFPSQVVTTF